MDKYDKAIEYLTEHPEEIKKAWGYCSTHEAGCLFDYAGSKFGCGCLTLVRDSFLFPQKYHVPFVAQTPELTEAIGRDERIPYSENDITLDHLPVFAEWQRKLDKYLARV